MTRLGIVYTLPIRDKQPQDEDLEPRTAGSHLEQATLDSSRPGGFPDPVRVRNLLCHEAFGLSRGYRWTHVREGAKVSCPIDSLLIVENWKGAAGGRRSGLGRPDQGFARWCMSSSAA